METTKKMNLILAINIFLIVGISTALAFSIIGTRRGIKAIREEAYQAFLIEDLSAKSRQWAISIEPLLRGDLPGGQDLFYLNAILLEDSLSSLKARPLSGRERELVERVSSQFYAIKLQVDKVLARGRLYREIPPPTFIEEITGSIEKLLGEVEALSARQKLGRRGGSI
jgi:hypothetical protein